MKYQNILSGIQKAFVLRTLNAEYHIQLRNDEKQFALSSLRKDALSLLLLLAKVKDFENVESMKVISKVYGPTRLVFFNGSCD